MKQFKILLFIQEIFRAVAYYRLKFFFSMLSISLGIGAIALIVAAVEGANDKAYRIFDVFGPDAVLVVGGGSSTGLRHKTKTLTLDDANPMMSSLPSVYETIPRVLFSPILIKYGNKSWSTSIIGTTNNYFNSLSSNLAYGNLFTEDDIENKSTVVIVGSKVKKELFPYRSGIGEDILIGKLPVKVIGVLEERGSAGNQQDLNDRIIMPISTVMNRLMGDDKYIASLWLRSRDDIDTTVKNVRLLLRYNHRLSSRQYDDFRIMTAKQILKSMKILSNNLIFFLGSAGLIALIVGGFIIANLSYLNIRQRQKEIGIKIAYGAGKMHIVVALLAEISLTTILGGALGIIWAAIGGYILDKFGQVPVVVSYKVVLVAFILSLIFGLAAGLRPALRAIKIDPIRAITG